MPSTTNETSTTTTDAPRQYVPAETVNAARLALSATGRSATYLRAEVRGQHRAAVAILAEYQEGTHTYASIIEATGWSMGTVRNRLILGAVLARLGSDATDALASQIQPAVRTLAPNEKDLTALLASSDAVGTAWAEHITTALAEHKKNKRAARPATGAPKGGKGGDGSQDGTDARTGSSTHDAARPATTAEILAAALREVTLMAAMPDDDRLAAVREHAKILTEINRLIVDLAARQPKPKPQPKPEPEPVATPKPRRTRKPKVAPAA